MVVHQLASHNSRGAVTMDLPIDPVSTAGDAKLTADILDILLEVIGQTQVDGLI